ncbi:MAG: hypothetical protein ABIQ86_14415 [Steroidobacteraceae bacterium]
MQGRCLNDYEMPVGLFQQGPAFDFKEQIITTNLTEAEVFAKFAQT